MASRITVRTRNGEYPGELDGSDISNAIWLSNRLTVEINMLGGMMYSVTSTSSPSVFFTGTGMRITWPLSSRLPLSTISVTFTRRVIAAK